MSKSALVAIANGTEEMEAVIVIDTLRRANINVTVASIEQEKKVTCSRGVAIVADSLFSEIQEEEYDIIILPGGKVGAEALRDCEPLVNKLRNQLQSDSKYVGAICAAPAVVLGSRNLFDGREATGYPSTWGSIEKVKHDRVVHDRNLITSQGPATTFEFAGEIVRTLCDENVAKNVLDAMLVSS